jgi:hypothetical protein
MNDCECPGCRIIRACRENWDVGFLVTIIGFILGWAIYVTVLGPLLP